MEESRVSIQEFEVKTGEIRDHCEAEQQRRQKMKRNLLTLENYTERYIPLTVLSTIDECFKPVFTDPIVKQRFQKKMDDMHVELSMQIIEDQGSGSIWRNIDQINGYISERLAAKINLTKERQVDKKNQAD